MKEVVKIQLSKIKPNKNQPRLEFDDDSIEGLATSIKEAGLLQPITVRKVKNGYELIAGERRYRACLLNGQKTIDAIVLEKDDDESANLALIENIQREDLNAIEQAMAMQRLMNQEDITQNELAKKLGYKQSTVANKIRLLKLPDYIKQAIADGLITERHARALLKVKKENLKEVFDVVIKKRYTVSKTEEYIKALTNKTRNRGIGANAKVGINTIEKAFDLCKKSGIDADMFVTEYQDEIKITIKIKK